MSAPIFIDFDEIVGKIMNDLPSVLPVRAEDYEVRGGSIWASEKDALVTGGYKLIGIPAKTLEPGEELVYNINPAAKGLIVIVDGVKTAEVGIEAKIQIEIEGASGEENPVTLTANASGKTCTVGNIVASPDFRIERVSIANIGSSKLSWSGGNINAIVVGEPKFAMFYRGVGIPYREMPYLVVKADIPRIWPGVAFYGIAVQKIKPINLGSEDPRVIACIKGSWLSSHGISDESWVADPLLEYYPVENASAAINANASNFNNVRGYVADGKTIFYAYSTMDIDRIASVYQKYAAFYKYIKYGRSRVIPPTEEVKDLFIFIDRRGVTQFDAWLVPPVGWKVTTIRTWSDQTHDIYVYGAWNEGANGVGCWLYEEYSATAVAANTLTTITPQEFHMHKVSVRPSTAGIARIIAYLG